MTNESEPGHRALRLADAIHSAVAIIAKFENLIGKYGFHAHATSSPAFSSIPTTGANAFSRVSKRD